MAKSYSLSKSKVREIISEKFGTEGSVDINDVLELFSSDRSGGSRESDVYVKDEDNNIVGKKCSYFGLYFDIEQFGKRGDSYGFQSKIAESIVRKARNDANKQKELLTEELSSGSITVDEWKEKLSDIEEQKDTKVDFNDIDTDVVGYSTSDDLLENL